MCQTKAQGGQRCFKDSCPTYRNSIKSGNVDKAKDVGRGIILTPNSIDNFKEKGNTLVDNSKTIIVESRQTVDSLENLNENLTTIEEQKKSVVLNKELFGPHKAMHARNSNDKELLNQLVEDDDPEVRNQVIFNSHATSDIINKLVNDPDETVRSYLASSNKARAATLETLAHDTDESVLENVAYNKKSKANAMAAILENPNAHRYTKEEAAKRLTQIDSGATTEQLELLIDTEDSFIAGKIAQHPNASKEQIETLYTKYPEQLGVVSGVLSHKDTPTQRLEEIYTNTRPDPNKYGHELKNEAFYQGTVFHKLAAHPNASIKLLDECSNNAREGVRITVASREDITPTMATKLSKDKSEIVRLAVASNPNTPKEVLANFIDNEESKGVASAAFYNPNMPNPELHEMPKEWLEGLMGDKIYIKDSDEAKYQNKTK